MLLKDSTQRPDLGTDQLIDALIRYVQEVLGITMFAWDWKGKQEVPLHISRNFAFKQADLNGQTMLLVIDQTKTWTPAALTKQLELIGHLAQLPVLFLSQVMTPQARAHLVGHRTAFAVPGLQLYLPKQGVAFKETFKRPLRLEPTLTISTQALVIHALLHPGIEHFQPGIVAKQFGYEPMTMTRAFNELEARHLAESHMDGKTRVLRFNDHGRELWERTKGIMATPVRKKVWLKYDTKVTEEYGRLAGLSALSDQTDLSPPACPVFAVPPTGWNWPGILAAKKDVLDYPENGTVEVEFWKYPPVIFTKDRIVDPFNLFLSLRDLSDERVQAGLRHLEDRLW